MKHHFPRREFIKKMATATGAVAGPALATIVCFSQPQSQWRK